MHDDQVTFGPETQLGRVLRALGVYELETVAVRVGSTSDAAKRWRQDGRMPAYLEARIATLPYVDMAVLQGPRPAA